MLTESQMNAIMEGFSRSHLSTLTKTQIWRMRKSDLQMECSFRGLPTKGDRSLLISRLMKTFDDDDQSPKDISNLKDLDASEIYVLRVNGYTTPNSLGAGIGLVLYTLNEELWTGRVYCPGDRSSFEAEYSAIVMGLDFAKSCGIEKLIVQSTNDAIVHQINGIYRVSKRSLKPLLETEKRLEEDFQEFKMAAIPMIQSNVASELATKALTTRKSVNIPKFWKFKDPLSLAKNQPEPKSEVKVSDEPAHTAEIDPSRVYLLRFDGGSRGNPGLAGAGFVVYDDSGTEIWSGWKYYSESATNNVAEYLGLLCGLKCAQSFGITQLIAEGDSQLVVKQVNGDYQVKNAVLKTYHRACTDILGDFDYFEVRYIPRAENSRADWLANHAMDSQESHEYAKNLDI